MVALVLLWGYWLRSTPSTEGLLTHVGTPDGVITLPHPALECGIVTASWQCQVEGATAVPRHHEDKQRQAPAQR